MKTTKILLIAGLLFMGTNMFGQYLPESYQPMLNEIVENFKTIRTGNSLTEGKNSIRVISDSRIVLRVKHKKKVKNLTFETKPDEENNLIWVATNQLTIDMVNKYEDFLTGVLKDMHKLSEKKSQE